MKKTLLLTIWFTATLSMYSQSVELHFPHFAGQEYTFHAFRGIHTDSISGGRLDAGGRARLSLPDKMKGYRGMTRWMLKGGGGLDIIFAGEGNFSVSCTDANPSQENIVYTGSKENTYLAPRYTRQQNILGRIEAMRMAAGLYKDDKALLPTFRGELEKQVKEYNLLQEQTAGDTLYAARFAQITDVTRGLPPVLTVSPAAQDSTLKDFMLNGLDMQALYTSGHWLGVIDQLGGWYAYNTGQQAEFIPDVKKILSRTPSTEVYTALCERIIAICNKHNWTDSETQLAYFLMDDGRIKEPTGRIKQLLTMLKVGKGAAAPALVSGTLPPGKTLLVFFESGCGSCTEQMNRLVSLYPQIKEKGYEVVSVSADADKATYQRVSQRYPWPYKYCDFEGFRGKDFVNYGVIGTPTLYLIEENGNIQGRYATVEDTGIMK